MSLKEEIAKSFGTHARAYHENSSVGRKSAKKLAALFDSEVNGEILEVGCGTGFVTEHLLKIYPHQPLTITDLSEEMVAFCKNEHFREKTTFKVLDGEKISEKKRYGLIVSGLALQWFFEPKLTIQRWYDALLPGGKLIFSFFNDRSFQSWKKGAQELGFPYFGNPLPSAKAFFEWEGEKFEESYQYSFKTPLHLFRYLKFHGMGTSLFPHCPYEVYRFVKSWAKETKKKETISENFDITYLAIYKRDA